MNKFTAGASNGLPEFTSDDFLGGKITLTQPRRGFRAGLDTLLLAASISAKTRNLLDLGAGVGTAGICALATLPGLQVTLVEAQPDLVTLAGRNLAANGFASRGRLIEADISASGAQRQAAGMTPDHFTSVIANPPFFDSARGTTAPEGNRAAARHMPAGELDKWVKAAATCAAPRGEVIFISPATALPTLLNSFASRFGAICIWPIAPRPETEATRVLVRGIKGSRAPLRLLNTLVLHQATGNHFAQAIDQVFRGDSRLHW